MTAAKQGDLFARVMAIKEKAMQNKERQALIDAEAEQARAKAEAAKVIKLPIWPEAIRAVPNGFLRSALFGAIKKGSRPYLERAEIHAQDGIQIRYTGARLDQGDLDVWETILHIVRDQALGNECRVNAYQILKLWGKTDTGKNRDTLDRRLSRMKATALDVSVGKYSYEGSLIDEVYRDKETKEYVIFLNPKLKALFEPDQFTQIQWNIRRSLDGQPLAQWLYSFFSSHAQPHPIKIETLYKLCGSEAGELWKFTQNLRRALEAVVQVCKEGNEYFSFEIENGLVVIKRQPTKSQKKHLSIKNH